MTLDRRIEKLREQTIHRTYRGVPTRKARLTHHCHIFEMNGESYRFRESVKKSKPGK